VVAVAVWRRGGPETAGALALAALAVRRVRYAAGVALLCVAGTVRGDAALRDLVPDRLGPYAGWVTVVADPVARFGATRVIVEVDGERFELWERGRAGQLRVARWQVGDEVWMSGDRRALSAERASRVAWEHVVGVFDREVYGDRRDGRRLDVASNRVRDLVARGTSVLGAPQDSLARGLVIGDDRDQPPAMVERFRASGLSHLTAVSGQNIILILAAAGPLLRRLRPSPRLVVTIALIGWFVVLTRAEPSVLRAGAMAGLGAIAAALGRDREPPRLLAVAVTGLLLVDPLLSRAVGFWLSVGATAGVTILAPVIARWMQPLGRLALPLAVTLGAQAGVAVPSLLVFGRLSVTGTLANLFAVPIAGLVMLYGLPASLVAGAVPGVAAVVMFPVGLGVRWVDRVAAITAAHPPSAAANTIGWIAVAVLVGALAVRRHRRGPPARADGDTDLPH